MAVDPLKSDLRFIKGVGEARALLLKKAGLASLEDVLHKYPRSLQDRRFITPISKLRIGEVQTLVAEVLRVRARAGFQRRLKAIVEISVADDTGRVFAVWFNQPYLKNIFKAGEKVLLHGKVELYRDRIQLTSPEYEVLGDEGAGFVPAGMVPVYSLPERFPQKIYRRVVKEALDRGISSVKETLPFDVRTRHKLLNIAQSLRSIHYPESLEVHRQAYTRLSFEEFFIYQLPVLWRRLRRVQRQGIAFKVPEGTAGSFEAGLPFVLTGDQKAVMAEIGRDMASPRPMQRLLQGDVGSGKTVVAVYAACVAAQNAYQTAFLVPTEILAQQHYEKITKYFEALGHKSQVTSHQKQIRVGMLTGRMGEKERMVAGEAVKKGEIDIVVGTHALIQEDVSFHKLGLVIIDEQHKFGVEQRSFLSQKRPAPDILIMTATPIPRTLSMTLYGDLDISVIREMPKGRGAIKTSAYPLEKCSEVYAKVREAVKQGRQAYVVYPIIEESEKLELSSAKKMFKEFTQKIFPDLKVGLLHGRLKGDEQEKVMARFRDGDIDILVATTVIEVGVDVPNATVMVIEHAERFGLSQLHQMRGRIGRGAHDSACYLIAAASTEEAERRLKVFVENLDGFRIAEEDLKLRGPGEFFGERQHGLADLKIADPLTQMHLLKAAREEAVRLLARDPDLADRNNQELKRQLHRRFPGFEKFVEVG